MASKINEFIDSSSQYLHVNLKKGVNELGELFKKKAKFSDKNKNLAVFEAKIWAVNITSFTLVTYAALIALRVMSPTVQIAVSLVAILALRAVAERSLEHEKAKGLRSMVMGTGASLIDSLRSKFHAKIDLELVDAEKVLGIFRTSPHMTACTTGKPVLSRYGIVELPKEVE